MGMWAQGSAEGLVRQEGQSCRGKDSPREGSSEQQVGPWHQDLTLLQMQKSGHTRSSGRAHKQRPVSHSAPGGEVQPPSQAFLGHALCQPLWEAGCRWPHSSAHTGLVLGPRVGPGGKLRPEWCTPTGCRWPGRPRAQRLDVCPCQSLNCVYRGATFTHHLPSSPTRD